MIWRTPPDPHCRADLQRHVDYTVLELLNSVELRDLPLVMNRNAHGVIVATINFDDTGYTPKGSVYELSAEGAPGADGMTVDDLVDQLKQQWPTIREQLLQGTYKPLPVKRVEIPNPDEGVRKLGIPTALDRFIQQTVLQVLQQRWDPRRSPDSAGSLCPGR